MSGYVLYELPHQHVHVITPMVAKDDKTLGKYTACESGYVKYQLHV